MKGILLLTFLLFSFGFETDKFSFRRRIRFFKNKPLNATTSNFTFVLEDVFFQLDTTSLIKKGHIRENCIDLIFVEEESEKRLDHYFENECDLENTRIFMQLNFTDNQTEKSVFMYYRHAEMNESVALQFKGTFYKFSDQEQCENGWKEESIFDEKFIFVDSNNVGDSNQESEPHSHFIFGESDDSDCPLEWRRNTVTYTAIRNHNHYLAAETSQKGNALPPYKKSLICGKNTNSFSEGLLELFRNETLPEGVVRYFGFDERFPMGSLTSRNEGGSQSHNHSFEGISQFPSDPEGSKRRPGSPHGGAKQYDQPKNHLHKFDGITEDASNIPPHFNVVFGKPRIDYLKNETKLDQTILMSDSLPPFGFQILEQFNGYYLRGSPKNSSINFFGEGGSPLFSHSHNYTTVLTKHTNENLIFVYGYWVNNHHITCDEFHEHNITGETFSAFNSLPYQTIMLISRKEIEVNYFMEEIEQIQAIQEYEDLCNHDCLNGGKCIYDKDILNYQCQCASGFFGDDCSKVIAINENEIDIVLVVSIIIAVLCGGFIVVLLIVASCMGISFGFILQKRRKEGKYNDMISNLVTNVDKEEELKEKLETEKIKFEEQKKKLEEIKKADEEEKKELKESLMLLKKEKDRLERQSLANFDKKDLDIVKIENIEKKILLLKKNVYGFTTYKAIHQNEMVLFRVFEKGTFDDMKHHVNVSAFFEYEVNEYSRFMHPNILEYKSITRKPLGIISEFPMNGTIYSYFNSKKKKKMNFFQKIRIIYEICSAVQYLHKKGVKHGNISSQTIFLSKRLRPKLDSGFCKTFDKQLIYSQYCPPEMIVKIEEQIEDEDEEDEQSFEDSPKAKEDVYSIGILMMEIVSQNFNLYKIDSKKRIKIGEKVANDENYRPNLGKSVKYYPNWFINIVKMCWIHSPSKRPSISRIKMIIETIVNEND